LAKEVVIIEAVRTAMGRRNGMLSGTHPVSLGAKVLREVVTRAGVEPGMVGDVVFGNVSQVGEQAANIGRNVVLEAGFPFEVPGTTVDRQCGSAQQAIHFAANLISSDVVDIAIGGGVEVMSRVPMGSNFQVAGFPFTDHMRTTYDLTSQGVAADNIARQWDISREQLDRFALESQNRAKAARDGGKFEKEILPVEVEHEGVKGVFKVDEGIRDSTLEKLASLTPSFGERPAPRATSQITDGAGRADDVGGQGEGAGVEAACAYRRAGGRGLRPAPDAHRPDHRDSGRAEESRAQARGHRPRRDQRGVRRRRAGVDEGDGIPAREDQRQRRRDRARPPARLHRRAPDDVAALRAGALGRPLRARGDAAAVVSAPRRSSSGCRGSP
jgi:acetyl-CoA acetyltransferase